MNVTRLINNLMVGNVRETVQFYTEFLGFKLMMAVPEGTQDVVYELSEGTVYSFAALKNGDVEIMFQSAESILSEFSGVGHNDPGCRVILYMQVIGLEELFEKIKDEVEIVKGLHEAFYGMKEFYVRDKNGYMLGFAEKA